MANLIIHPLLLLLFITTLLSQSQGCGRNRISSSECINRDVWDLIDDNDELRTKRDVSDITADVEVVDNLDGEESNGHYRVKRETPMPRYVYRVLRPDEDPKKGLKPKNPGACFEPTDHVCNGNVIRTQYISTMADIAIARRWARRDNHRFVRIDLVAAQRAGVKYHDIRYGQGLENLQAINYARASREVLLYGVNIPASVIKLWA